MITAKIRLIFCDVDGTILPTGQSLISDDVFHAIDTAVSSGIKFCIASGRSYIDLLRLFTPVANNVTFICSDGSLIVEHGDIIFSTPLNKSQIACMSKTYKNDYQAILIYGKDNTYCISDSKDFDFCKKIHAEDIPDLPENIYKVAFLNLSKNAKIKIDNLGIKSGILNKIYEDSSWTEYITSHTDKGVAAKELQKLYSIQTNETAAFGDYLNDIGMLRQATVSYAPESAKPEIVRMCKYTTNNVTNEILNIINNM